MNPYYEVEWYDDETDTRVFIVIDQLIGGLAAGGIRMSPTVTMEDIRSLAHLMTKKNSVMGIPLGGAKIGIVGDPEGVDKEEKLKAFGRMAESLLKTKLLIGEDMGISSQNVKSIYESIQFNPIELVAQIRKQQGMHIQMPEGKSIDDLLSEEFMDYLAGFGLMEAMEEAAQLINLDLNQAQVGLQGFGTVGSGIAMLLLEKGSTITAISDAHRCMYRQTGFSLAELQVLKEHGGVIQPELFRNVKIVPSSEIVGLPVDIFIPASISNAIHRDNAGSLKASLIVEAANFPTTNEAEQILLKMHKMILPDFVVNAGSATGFGLLITGQAEYQDVFQACAQRIRETVRTILTESLKGEKTPREIADEMASYNLNEMVTNEQAKVETK
ncbi:MULTISPECIES: Glu/Leu/Phe/Val family dehydrogenase [Shouchella]|uniref:Glutamate dehydrogenase n=2 Tax=Shouchella TaxID=2893057 RepID=A0ABY7W3B5_9BACI|nr:MULTISPECIES: Glu/Leu/Phe/Val dehydrogenase [Shouchella]MED4129748.1 Glu/Leu/Phe/Val dehydrogenase [Shouchella miscanthi]WDF02084.1 Glu/Leu/Phe/Val dehydrogenase [Shouchella hunanensis]